MNNKRGFVEIPFAWLFGIIAGVVILMLAIFAATKVINIGQGATGGETQKEIAVLLNPLETSFQTGQVVSLTLPSETRIYNECDETSGIFGEQIISVSQQNLGKWTQRTSGASFQNKYIFSEQVPEGKKFLLFSKPVEFPFKISDVIYMTSASTNYCFVEPSENIEEELSNLNQENLAVANSTSECSSESITICFDRIGCDIEVYSYGIVKKEEGEVTYYGDSLMYGAIFSNNSVYECQLKRLMERATQLSSLYVKKAETIERAGCSSNLNQELSLFSSLANAFSESGHINALVPLSNEMQRKNDATTCKLW